MAKPAFATITSASSIIIGIRILRQLRRDRRTLAMVLLVPIGLLALLRVILEHEVGGRPVGNFDALAPALISTFVFFFVFVLSVVGFLRERTEGTFERILSTPGTRSDLIIGYMLGYLTLALVQSALTVTLSVTALDVDFAGSLGYVFLIQFTLALVAVNLGIMLSTFARTEFQAVQFIPIAITPQIILAGTIFPIEKLPDYLRGLAWVFPLRYGIEATRGVMIHGSGLDDGALLRD